MNYRDNLARVQYTEQVQRIEDIKSRNLKVVPKRKRLTIFKLQVSNMLMMTTLVFCAVTLISSYANLAVLTKQEATLTEQLGSVKSAEISLTSRLNNMFNLGYVEDYATNNLDMIKVDQAQIEYVNISNDDEIFIKESKVNTISNLVTQTYYKVMEYMG